MDRTLLSTGSTAPPSAASPLTASPFKASLAAAVLAAAIPLSACAPMPPAEPSPPYTGQCDAGQARWAIGQAATADVVERIRIDTRSQAVRTIRPGQAVTMDYSAARANVHVNERNAITGVTCG
jgi:hypothetical protein